MALGHYVASSPPTAAACARVPTCLHTRIRTSPNQNEVIWRLVGAAPAADAPCGPSSSSSSCSHRLPCPPHKPLPHTHMQRFTKGYGADSLAQTHSCTLCPTEPRHAHTPYAPERERERERDHLNLISRLQETSGLGVTPGRQDKTRQDMT